MVAAQSCRSLRPPQLLQAHGVIPDLRHVADLVAVKLHRINIVRRDRLPRGLAGAARPGLGAVKYRKCTDTISFFVSSKKLQFISAIR